MKYYSTAVFATLLPSVVWHMAGDGGGILVMGFSPAPSASCRMTHRSSNKRPRSFSSSHLRVVESATLMDDHPGIVRVRQSKANRAAQKAAAAASSINKLGINMPDGLRDSLETNAQVFHKHIWIVDNSGSMIMEDGHHAVSLDVDCSVKDCTRWQEVQETVNCHAQLAQALGVPTDFKLLNPINKKMGGRSQTFRVGYHNNNHHNDLLHNNPIATRFLKHQNPTKQMESALAKARPCGMTPLPKCIQQVKQEVESMLPQLLAEGTKVSIIIATDGCNYNLDNVGTDAVMTEEERNQELVQALESLQDLPVNVVIRLCTDYAPLVDFFNSLDDKMDWNLDIDVLDDHKAEAAEVNEHQPWLNYALLLHRMREMGHYHPLLDLLDERPLTASEIRDFMRLLFGNQHFTAPHENTEAWAISFLHELMDIQEREQTQSCYWNNPRTDRKEPWIDIEQLAYTLLDNE